MMAGVYNARGLGNSRPLRLWLDSGAPQIEALICSVYDAIGGANAVRQKRSLALRHIKLVLLNLLTIAAKDRQRYCAYSRTRDTYAAKSRYNPLGISPGIIEIVDALAAVGLIDHYPGFLDRATGLGKLSRMRATDRLLSLVEIEPNELPALIQMPAGTECIKLYPPKAGGKRHAPLEYADTDETLRMRAVLTDYNERLQRTSIELAMHPDELRDLGYDPDEWRFDPSKKRLYRVFNDGRWDHGGRFYGGFWESLPSELRARILIDGRPTVELDYSAIHIRLLYGLRGIDYEKEIGGDPYQLDGVEQSPRMRAVLKKGILTGVNAASFNSAVRGLRKALSSDKAEFGWVFDENVSLPDLLKAMIDKHKLIKGSLFTGQGICLQYLDSQITERLMTWAMENGIVLLPVHDSYIIDERWMDYLDHNMQICLREVSDDFRYRYPKILKVNINYRESIEV